MSTYEGANLAWQLSGDARLLHVLAEDADVLALVECRNKANEPVDVRATLGPAWSVAQNTRTAALAGTAIALRRGGPVKRRHVAIAFRRLLQVSRGTSRVQARYVRTLPIRDTDGPATLFVVHIPLASTGLQDEALAELGHLWRRTKGRKLLFADGNISPAALAAAIGAPCHDGDGVMVWCWSRGWARVRVSWRKRRGTDHKVGRLCTDAP